jgi:LAS superfamily LD-carboxypeptidase LdcB
MAARESISAGSDAVKNIIAGNAAMANIALQGHENTMQHLNNFTEILNKWQESHNERRHKQWQRAIEDRKHELELQKHDLDIKKTDANIEIARENLGIEKEKAPSEIAKNKAAAAHDNAAADKTRFETKRAKETYEHGKTQEGAYNDEAKKKQGEKSNNAAAYQGNELKLGQSELDALGNSYKDNSKGEQASTNKYVSSRVYATDENGNSVLIENPVERN